MSQSTLHRVRIISSDNENAGRLLASFLGPASSWHCFPESGTRAEERGSTLRWGLGVWKGLGLCSAQSSVSKEMLCELELFLPSPFAQLCPGSCGCFLSSQGVIGTASELTVPLDRYEKCPRDRITERSQFYCVRPSSAVRRETSRPSFWEAILI